MKHSLTSDMVEVEAKAGTWSMFFLRDQSIDTDFRRCDAIGKYTL